MQTAKKIAGIIVNVLMVFIFVIALLVIIANAGREKDEVPNLFGFTFASVQSESMEPTFEKGDMLVGKLVDEDTEIKVGDIISFYQIENNYKIINSHRVIAIVGEGENRVYYTMGDKVRAETHGSVDAEVTIDSYGTDAETKTIGQIVAVYRTHLNGVGGFIDFLKKPVGFILLVVLPIVVVILWQVYRLIALYMENKKSQILEEAKASAEPTDEMKNAIIEEYLKSVAQSQGEQEEEKKE